MHVCVGREDYHTSREKTDTQVHLELPTDSLGGEYR